MRFKHISYVVSGLAALMPWAIISAQEVDFGRFEIPVRQAIVYNKDLINAELENQKVILTRQQVKGKRLPKVSANASYGYLNSAIDLDLPAQTLPLSGVPIFEGSQKMNLSSQIAMTGITATQVIFGGLQIHHGEKALDQKIEAQQLLSEAGYDGLAMQIVQNFDQLMLLKEVDDLIVDSEKRLKREHQKVIKAIENGMAIPYDRDKIKLAMLTLESKKAELSSNRALLYLQLEELTGLSSDDLNAVDYPLQEITLREEQIDLLERKELQALQASQMGYEHALKKEKGALLPQVFAFGNISYFNAFNTRLNLKDVPTVGELNLKSNHVRMAPNYAVGIGVRWTIFEGRTHKNAVEKAKLDVEINKNKIQDTQQKLSLLQRKAKTDYELALKKLPVSRQQMLISENNLHLATRQFQEGLIDITERLKAENDLVEQSLNYYQQIVGQRHAAADLLKVNGHLYQTITK
ncbi:MAG: TolC family protein [Sphingobacterium sp.]